MEGMEIEIGVKFDVEGSRNLWSGVWGKIVNYNDEVEWLRELEEEMNGVEKQVNVEIDVDSVMI